MTPEPIPTQSVKLSVYDWHGLLYELEQAMRIVNRDRHNLKVLYGKIATQLAGHEVKVLDEPPPPSVEVSPVPAPVRKTWWKWLS